MTATATLPQTAATLPLADEIARLRQALDASSGTERRSLTIDLRWCRIDQSREIRDDLAVLELALALADQGDQDAAAALELADQLEPIEAPTSVGQPWALSSPTVATLRLDELVDELAAHRRAGLDFDAAWARAVAPFGPTGELARALRWSRPAWASAFRRTTPPRGYRLGDWGEPGSTGQTLGRSLRFSAHRRERRADG